MNQANNRLAELKALNQFKKSLVFEHPTEVGVKLDDDFKMLKKYSRTMVICVLNCTKENIEMVHSNMTSGVHKRNSQKTVIKAQEYEHFTFHNSMFTGAAGEIHVNHSKKTFRIAFENPLIGSITGFTSESDISKPFPKDQGTKNLKDHKPQGSAESIVETRFKQERYPPIYTVVIQNL